jgi:hypothetical protein
MLAMTALAAGLRAAMLREYLDSNPIAHAPWSDGEVYWEDAGRIAAGEWRPSTPFLAAPLYPYFLALIRAAGGGLSAVYVTQLALHLLTGVLVGILSAGRFGRWAGVAALVFFFALTEPAISALRVLGTTLQLLLITLVWWAWSAAERTPGRVPALLAAAAGLVIGFFALTYPTALLLIPAFAGWAWWRGGRAAGAIPATIAVLLAGGVVALPTLHNWSASGDWIPISAHGGITLRQGNGPQSKGIFTYVRDIDPDRRRMHASAAAVFAARHGREGSWAEIDRHFRNEVFDFWARHPVDTAGLIGRKLFWFLSSMNYDDIAPLPLEREAGLAQRSWLAPLPTAWLLGLATIGLVHAARSGRGWRPELLLLALPLVTVLIFFYTPRYRLPAAPMVCGLAGLAAAGVARLRLPVGLAAPIAAAPLALTFVSVAIGYDAVDRWRAPYRAALLPALVELGDQRLERGDLDGAAAAYDRALRLDRGFGAALRQLGAVHLRRGDRAAAERAFRVALASDLRDAEAHRQLYNLLAADARYREAADILRSLRTIEPQVRDPLLFLAWLLATCPDESIRKPGEAVRLAEAARETPGDPDDVRLSDALAAAYAAAGDFDQAQTAATQAVAARQRRGAADSSDAETRRAHYAARRACTAPPMTFAAPR